MNKVTITIANHKGGVGKTTTAVNLAAGLAQLGHRVTIIDYDVQGHVAAFLGIDKQPGLYRLLIQEWEPERVMVPVPDHPNLTIIPGDGRTLDVNRNIAQSEYINAATFLRDAITGLPADVVIIDTAPSMTEIQFSALNASRWLLIPALPEFASEEGISALISAVARIQERRAHTITLLGILPTMYQVRRSEHQDTVKAWKEQFKNLLLPEVRNLTELGEAPGRGKTIWRYAPSSEAAKDYAKVLLTVIKRTGINGKKQATNRV